jgi:hypothetical protein
VNTWAGLTVYKLFLLLLQAFRKIDSQKRGTITINEIRKYFNGSFQPPYKQGRNY